MRSSPCRKIRGDLATRASATSLVQTGTSASCATCTRVPDSVRAKSVEGTPRSGDGFGAGMPPAHRPVPYLARADSCCGAGGPAPQYETNAPRSAGSRAPLRSGPDGDARSPILHRDLQSKSAPLAASLIASASSSRLAWSVLSSERCGGAERVEWAQVRALAADGISQREDRDQAGDESADGRAAARKRGAVWGA